MTGGADTLPDGLLREAAFPHPTAGIHLVETHLSWVFLTGEHAYKVKKPVRYDFVDFSTLERRRYFCDEELRCNRTFAPELYVAVEPVTRADDGTLELGGTGEIVDWAVHMHQFDEDAQCDRLLESGLLGVAEVYRFGRSLAGRHARLPPLEHSLQASAGPMLDNFDTLNHLASARAWRERLHRLRELTVELLTRQRDLILARIRDGFVRECHGDLHLSNLVRTAAGIRAFDCLEFDVALRTIDVWCDVAFLFMDCLVRGRADLAYAFIDGYLDESGDYCGVRLLTLFALYRSMVRAKVAALKADASADDAAAVIRLERHVRWADDHARRPPGVLLIMHGLSASGKSYWAERLVPELGAIRLRSDVWRKRTAGLASTEPSHSPVAGGLYSTDRSAAVYEGLADIAHSLLREGEWVIVDAACLRADDRHRLAAAAQQAHARHLVVSCTAPEDVLRARIEARHAQGGDPSEANLEVLDWQLAHSEPPGPDEHELTVDTSIALTAPALARRVRGHLAQDAR